MILKYGQYAHAVGEAAIVITAEPLFDDRGAQYATRERWNISGFLQAPSQAALSVAIKAFKAAYAVRGQDVGLYLDDGVTLTSHYLKSAATIGGVRVARGPSFPQGRGAEYSTFRGYEIGLEADLPAAVTDGLFLWEESLTFSGGGPRFVYLQTLTGLPQRQLVAESTPFQVTQTGRAVGLFGYPLPHSPIWPAAEHVDRRQITRKAPPRSGPVGSKALTKYEVNWQYSFEFDSPLVGNPLAR